jgi:8-oxo-dGTP pyrophosphatase MutT (NUDIX family)
MSKFYVSTIQKGKYLRKERNPNGKWKYIYKDPAKQKNIIIASVAVIKDGKFLLMGKRRDSNKWTLPGGHVEPGESPLQGAKRELEEEAGINADSLTKIGEKDIKNESGRKLMEVHAYKYEVDKKVKTTMTKDPDEEVQRWKWVNIENGLPEEILENLHAKKNIVLQKLGLQKAMRGIMDIVKGKTISIDKKDLIEEHENLIDVLESPSKEDDKKEAKKQKKELAEYTKKGGPGSGRKPMTASHEANWGNVSYSDKDSVFYESPGRKLKNKMILEMIKKKEKEHHKKQMEKMKKEGKLPHGYVAASGVSFIIDLMKGNKPHKYIRKYRRGGKWIYVYKEPGQKARQIPEEAMDRLRQLAEDGDENAQRILAEENKKKVADRKLEILRQLADDGVEEAKKHLKRELAINRKEERLEEDLIGESVAPEGPHQIELTEEQQHKFDEAVREGAKAAVHRAYEYMDYDVTRQFRDALGNPDNREKALDKIVMASKGDTIEERLKNLNEILKVIDEKQGVQPGASFSSSFSSAKEAGGYANLTWNGTIKKLTSKGILPDEYLQAVPRTAQSDVTIANPEKVREEIERARAEEAERQRVAEEERRRRLEEMREGITDSMAYHMMSLFERSGYSDEQMIEKSIKLQEKLTEMFGKDLKKEDWPYDFSDKGYQVKISRLNFSGSSIGMSFKVKDRDGNSVTERWDRTWSGGINDSKTQIYNDYFIVNSSARGADAPLGALVNQSQVAFIKAHAPNNGQIAVTAALSVGGYNWANQGFAFTRTSTLESYRSQFQRFLSRKGINLTDADMQHFKLPCHFSAFHDGKFYESSSRPAPLTPNQKKFGNLEGKEGGATPLLELEIGSGKTNRFHLGKVFLMGESWSGVFKVRDMAEGKEQYEHLKNWNQLKLDAWQGFKPDMKKVVEAVQAGERAGRTTSPSTPTRGSPDVSSAPRRAGRAITGWQPSGNRRNITVTEARLRNMRFWTVEDFDYFIRSANLTANGRARVRARKREVHG